MTTDLQRYEFEEMPYCGRADQMELKATGSCCRWLAGCIGVVILLSARGWTPPPWLQPSIIGMLWGSLFLIGAAAGSIRRGSSVFACLGCGYAWVGRTAMQSLTTMNTSECSLLTTGVIGAGWLMVQLDYSALRQPASPNCLRPYRQWTMWDLALLTTLSAIICSAIPFLESPSNLLFQVGFVLSGGCMCSWVAYRWVFDDRWNICKLLVLLMGSALCFWLLVRQTPPEFSWLHILAWMMTGSVAVMAAQGLTVLAVLTAIRVDRGSLTASKSAVDERISAPAIEGLRIHPPSLT